MTEHQTKHAINCNTRLHICHILLYHTVMLFTRAICIIITVPQVQRGDSEKTSN